MNDMYRVEDKRYGATYQVFMWNDPRKDGYTGNVEDGVSLVYDMEAVHRWAHGTARPEAVLGRDPKNPKYYKVFKYSRELEAAGFQPVAGKTFPFGSWSIYLKLNPDRKELEKLDEEFW